MLKWSTMPAHSRVGAIGIVLFLLFAFVGPFFSPHGDLVIGKTWSPPSEGIWLGTDNIGRDLLTRLMYGTQFTIILAGLATVLSFTVGTVLGFLAAVMRGWTDQVLSRGVDLLMSIPTLIFALVVLSVLPRSIGVMIAVTALLDATRVFRLSRAVALDIAVQDFVEAARLRGEGRRWIILREILPNALSPLVAEFGLRFCFAMLFLSSLSFLGLGIQPPDADLGRMIRDNKEGIAYGIAAALYPGAVIALLTLSVNMLVDGILKRTASLKGGR